MKSNSDTWTLWTDRQIHRLTDIKRDRSTDRQTDRQAYSLSDAQTNRSTDI